MPHSLSSCFLALSRCTFVVAAPCLLLLSAHAAKAQVFDVPVNPRGTYLRVSPLDNTDFPVVDSTPFSLDSVGINPGDVVRFNVLGGYSFAIGRPDITQDTITVFSTNNVLLPSDQLLRVPGAVSAGLTFATPNTFADNLPTDIPEDFNFGFRTPNGLTLTVPQGAEFLFFSVSSSAFSDNTDPNSDYATRITVISRAPVPEPGAFALLAGIVTTGLVALRRRKQG